MLLLHVNMEIEEIILLLEGLRISYFTKFLFYE